MRQKPSDVFLRMTRILEQRSVRTSMHTYEHTLNNRPAFFLAGLGIDYRFLILASSFIMKATITSRVSQDVISLLGDC